MEISTSTSFFSQSSELNLDIFLDETLLSSLVRLRVRFGLIGAVKISFDHQGLARLLLLKSAWTLLDSALFSNRTGIQLYSIYFKIFHKIY